jgi:Ubiquitin-conjugating enzyme
MLLQFAPARSLIGLLLPSRTTSEFVCVSLCYKLRRMALSATSLIKVLLACNRRDRKGRRLREALSRLTSTYLKDTRLSLRRYVCLLLVVDSEMCFALCMARAHDFAIYRLDLQLVVLYVVANSIVVCALLFVCFLCFLCGVVAVQMKFITKVWHPNISSQTGAICLVSHWSCNIKCVHCLSVYY